MMAFIFFSQNLTSFKTPTRLVGCDFSGLIFGDLTDSQANSAGSIPVTRHQRPSPATSHEVLATSTASSALSGGDDHQG
jgi:hypothetical protein